ncbi:MAG: Ca-activated chloride channel family protein [Alphaproteobacteria bacterium]|jgi:Ca-activated chloride channel family protein
MKKCMQRVLSNNTAYAGKGPSTLLPQTPKLLSLCVAFAMLSMACTTGPSDKEAKAEQERQAKTKYIEVDVTPAQSKEHNTQDLAHSSDAKMIMPRAALAMRIDPPQQPPPPIANRDDFQEFSTSPVKLVNDEPVSTFSSDVDTSAYSFVRRQLNSGFLPTKQAVRLEEMVNYFDYQYPKPQSADEPFKATTLVYDSPWAKDRKLVHIGIQGYEIAEDAQPNSNLVFLLDVSGSMNSPDKLPLVKQSMALLLEQLKPSDTVSIVVYAGAAGTVLAPTKVENKAEIFAAMEKLSAGGSTAGGQGIELAYRLAEQNFNEDAVNRIILATDGDFNVGLNDTNGLQDFVERKREKGIFLSVLGFGQGNYQDHLMQSLAQNGNGIAAYIDTLSEAQKVLVHEATSALFPIANDLKIQLEFNPKVVKEYRLLGYETRALAQEDFNNDKVDAGDIGSGHSVTAIYEVTLVGSEGRFIDDLRYDNTQAQMNTDLANELGFLKLRYTLPGDVGSTLLEQAIVNTSEASDTLLREARFAASVAGFAQLLKDAKYTGNWNMKDALELALANRGEDEFGYRNEFVQLVRKATLAQPARM